MMAELSETDRIESDLARTRARMDERLEQLQDHLIPKQMLNDAFGYFQGGDGAEFTSDLISRAKANPIPVALVGVGIAWLMASGSSASAARLSAPRHDDLEARLRIAEGNVYRFDDDDDDSYTSRLDEARGKVLGIARTASDTAASYARRIKDATGSLSESVRSQAQELTSQLGGSGRAQSAGNDNQEGRTMARSARETLTSITSNPLALGGFAAVVGLVAGALLPTLDEEEAALGSVATKVRTAGRDLAQDVVDRGGRIANETLDAVKGSAEAHGLTSGKPVGELLSDVRSGDLVGNVKQVAQEALQAGKDSAQTHLTGSGQTDESQQRS